MTLMQIKYIEIFPVLLSFAYALRCLNDCLDSIIVTICNVDHPTY
jgi:hypothetical protein